MRFLQVLCWVVHILANPFDLSATGTSSASGSAASQSSSSASEGQENRADKMEYFGGYESSAGAPGNVSAMVNLL